MRTKLTCLFLLACSISFGQINQFDYKRELSGITEQWHKIILPDALFEKISPDFSDIRIFGVTEKKDTLEAPYILQAATEKISLKELDFNLINQSKNERGYYFTFEIPSERAVNQIQLEFNQQNFDWRVTLEGSHNQQEWFSIVENYRILSIKNELTDYQFTRVSFPESRYRYVRLMVDSEKKPQLVSAKIALNEMIDGHYRNYPIRSIKVSEEKQHQQTNILLKLNATVPVCRLKIKVKNSFDYYRPITIRYLSDSVKSENGWKYAYSALTSATLNSVESNEFKFSSTLLKEMKITIDNQDNAPLQINSVVVDGYVYELIARFGEPAQYSLAYGNRKALKPQYDISHFGDKIPAQLTALNLGAEQLIEKEGTRKTGPLFQNKNWMWAIMVVIIALLGWFSIRMMRQKD